MSCLEQVPGRHGWGMEGVGAMCSGAAALGWCVFLEARILSYSALPLPTVQPY